jgi:hypothetical protein
MVGLVKPKHVGAFIVNLNANFNILKRFNCALVGLIKDLLFSLEYHFLTDPAALFRTTSFKLSQMMQSQLLQTPVLVKHGQTFNNL